MSSLYIVQGISGCRRYNIVLHCHKARLRDTSRKREMSVANGLLKRDEQARPTRAKGERVNVSQCFSFYVGTLDPTSALNDENLSRNHKESGFGKLKVEKLYLMG